MSPHGLNSIRFFNGSQKPKKGKFHIPPQGFSAGKVSSLILFRRTHLGRTVHCDPVSSMVVKVTDLDFWVYHIQGKPWKLTVAKCDQPPIYSCEPIEDLNSIKKKAKSSDKKSLRSYYLPL